MHLNAFWVKKKSEKKIFFYSLTTPPLSFDCNLRLFKILYFFLFHLILANGFVCCIINMTPVEGVCVFFLSVFVIRHLYKTKPNLCVSVCVCACLP